MNPSPVRPAGRYGQLVDLGVAEQICGDHQLRFIGSQCKYSISTFSLGRCVIGRLCSPPMTLVFPGGKRRGDLDGFNIAFTSGRARFRQSGVTYLLAPNSCIAYDPVNPYVFSHPIADEQLYIHIPRALLASRYTGILHRPQVFNPGETGLAAILRSLLESTCKAIDLVDEASRSRLSTTVAQLAADLLETRAQPVMAESLSLDVLLHRIKAYVAANIEDPGLSVARIAEKMRCSQRYVYRAFEAENVSPGRYLHNTRLELARLKLSVAAESTSLSEAALLSGFSCYAHFSRAFKTQFGMAPRDWRQNALSGNSILLTK